VEAEAIGKAATSASLDQGLVDLCHKSFIDISWKSVVLQPSDSKQ